MQLDALRALLLSRGSLPNGAPVMVLAGEQYIYKEEGVSGTVALDERPAFSRLKEDIFLAGDEKPFDIVAVYKIDRFARKLTILFDVIDFLEEHGVNFISVNESIDTTSPFGKAIIGIIGVIAELELETIKQRTQEGRAQAVKQGKVMGANASYGYNKDIDGKLEVFEEEAKTVREIFSLFVEERKAPYAIALELKERMIISPAVSSVVNKKRAGVF